MWEIVLPLCKTGIALGSIFVVTQVMGDFFVVQVMSGGQSASVVSALLERGRSPAISAAPPPARCILVIIVTLWSPRILRLVDVRKELAR